MLCLAVRLNVQDVTERCSEITDLLQEHSCVKGIPGNRLYLMRNKTDSSNTSSGTFTVASSRLTPRRPSAVNVPPPVVRFAPPARPEPFRLCPHGGSRGPARGRPHTSGSASARRGMMRALGRWRARLAPRPPGPRRGLARRRDSEGGRPIPFSGSKASPRFWSVSRSMGSDHERPLVKVLPLSVLCTGVLLWCAFREETDVEEGVLSGPIVDSLDTSEESSAPLQLRKEN